MNIIKRTLKWLYDKWFMLFALVYMAYSLYLDDPIRSDLSFIIGALFFIIYYVEKIRNEVGILTKMHKRVYGE